MFQKKTRKLWVDKSWVPPDLRDRFAEVVRKGAPDECRIDDEGRKRCVYCDRPIVRMTAKSAITKTCASRYCNRLRQALNTRRGWHPEDIIKTLHLDPYQAPVNDALKIACRVHNLEWRRMKGLSHDYEIWDPIAKNRTRWDGTRRRARSLIKVGLWQVKRGADLIVRLDCEGMLMVRSKCERLRRPRGVAAKATYARIAKGLESPRPYREAGAWVKVKCKLTADDLVCSCEPCRIGRLLITRPGLADTVVTRDRYAPAATVEEQLEDANLLGHVEGDDVPDTQAT